MSVVRLEESDNISHAFEIAGELSFLFEICLTCKSFRNKDNTHLLATGLLQVFFFVLGIVEKHLV